MPNICPDNLQIKEFQQTLKLHINQKLYDEEFITEEMYLKAKNVILKQK